MADPAKTAKKSTALPPRIVPKTSRYPMAENQAQSTRKSLVRPSTMKQATMTITAPAMPLLGGRRVLQPVILRLLELLFGQIQSQPVVIGLEIPQADGDVFSSQAQEGADIDDN